MSVLVKSSAAAKILQISERKLWDLMNNGDVPHVRIGASVRYMKSDLAKWMQNIRSEKPEGEGKVSENNGNPSNEPESVKSLHLFKNFNWTKRARTAFHECNIHTLEQLLAMNPGRILKVENVGKNTLVEIQKKLTARGLTLRKTKAMEHGAAGWTPERRQKAADRGRKIFKEMREKKKSDSMWESLDGVIEKGGVAAAQLLLECCDPEMAKRMIDLVSAIGRESVGKS